MEFNDDVLASIGFGVRFQSKKNFNLSLNYGYVLDQARQVSTTADEGNVKWHFNVVYKY